MWEWQNRGVGEKEKRNKNKNMKNKWHMIKRYILIKDSNLNHLINKLPIF